MFISVNKKLYYSFGFCNNKFIQKTILYLGAASGGAVVVATRLNRSSLLIKT